MAGVWGESEMYSVLVAEDEPLIRTAIVEMVERMEGDYRVVGSAANGEEAWSLINELWPVILVTDIRMPQLDGLALIRRIHERKIPITFIILSGYGDFEYAQQAIHYGVTEYLLKPVAFETLLKALHRSSEQFVFVQELNDYFVRFQQFVDSIHKLGPKQLIHRLDDLIHSVLILRHINYTVRLNLLCIFEGKIRTILEEYGVQPNLAAIDFNRSDDVQIMAYFNSLVEYYIIYVPKIANQWSVKGIERCCQFIQDHFHDDISLTEMAEYANLSVSHFSLLFKQQTGCSLVNYINSIRLEKAKKWLRDTDLKIYEIAENAGFSSFSYFTRVFKSAVGISPNEYRKSLGL